MDNTIGIYIHIPFCAKKCPYCNFNSIAAAKIPDNAYTDAVLMELSAHIKSRPFLPKRILETVYIGGGTPSMLSIQNIKKLVNGIKKTFPNSHRQEITIEINPGAVSENSFISFRDAHINRLSIGIQSLNDMMLKTLGRIHSAQDSLKCCEYARKAGFENIGIDLIFGAPGQSVDEWTKDIEAAVSLKPEHIAAYNLTLEEGTSFFDLQKSRRLFLPSEEEQIAMYEIAIDKLKAAGYHHYEISNFSLNNFESQHNLRYWSCKDYIGLGAGAHSYISLPEPGMRWWNESEPNAYMRQINDSGIAIAGEEKLTKKEALGEGLFLGLRKTDGIDTDWFGTRFNVPIMDFYAHQITKLKMQGLLYENERNLKLTRSGLLMSNAVFAEFV